MNFIKSDLQVLLTGCYRSGTDYSSVLINNHPKLIVTTYTTSFMRYSYDRYSPIHQKKNYINLLKEAKKRIKNRWNRNLNIKKIINYCNNQKKVSYSMLYDLMMSDLFLEKNITKWGEKTQLVWRQIPDFLKIFPKGKAINIIRDPRSVLASFKKSTYNPEPAYLGAIFNCYDSMEKSLLYKKKYPSRFMYFKYEDIALDPKKTLKKIYNFLKLDSKHNLLHEKEWLDATGKKFHHNSVFANKRTKKNNFNLKSSTIRWKKNLSNNEVSLCEHINGKLMKEFKYKSSYSRNWEHLLPVIFKDEKIHGYFKNWLLYKQGVQEFPNDPLNPKNWDENN